MTHHAPLRPTLVLFAALLLGACTDDAPAPPPQKHDQLTRAVRQPLDQAKAADQASQANVEAQRKALDEASGTEPASTTTPPSQ